MKRMLLDLNVILDILLDRRPYIKASSAVWKAVENQLAEGLLAAHGVTTIHYLLARSRGRRSADQLVAAMLTVLKVAAVDDRVIGVALAFAWDDFDDAVCAAAAELAGCEAIITRDPRGFSRSRIPALSPDSALAWLSIEE